jgi:hypothetical protein
MATAVTMPRMWKLRDLQVEGGVSSNDLLLEISDVTFATTTTASVPTAFANGQVLGIFIGKQTSSAIYYTAAKTVTTAAVVVTSSVTNCTETVTVMVLGKAQV